MKKIFVAVIALLLALGVAFLAMESPVKTLESLAIRHADKLPLGYFGEKLFNQHCASCHDNPATHAPGRDTLAGFSKESVMVALGFGKMQPMAAHLSKREQFLIAMYLTGSGGDDSEWIAQHSCEQGAGDDDTVYAANWGLGQHNRRFVPADLTGITRDNVGTLELAWSLAFPKVTDMRSQPAIIGDTLYFGDKSGKLYALDRRSGCVRNYIQVLSGIRSAISAVTLQDGRQLLVFADSMASIFAVDPQTLEIQWQQAARLYDTSIITGSISYHDGRLFVPVSSYEAAVSGSPSYQCCHSHGGVIALDASSGRELWQWHATANASAQGQTSSGTDIYGPSGASVWSTPTIDAKRKRIYFGTGENLTHPATDTSDAIIALDMETGELAWKFQATAGDVWNSACLSGGPNCPVDPGGDFDFGASVILAQLPDGEEILLAGQKSGDVYALATDPATAGGELLWHQRVSNVAVGPDLASSTTNGGVHWGMALAGQRLIVPAADPERDRPDYVPRPGLTALDISSGEILWTHPVSRDCELDEANKPLIGLENTRSNKTPDLQAQYLCSFYYGLSAAAVATPELVFSGALNGVARALDISNGKLLWQTSTAIPFVGDNGVKGHGGAIDVSGQVLAGDWLYLQSGYSMFGQLPGNVLLAFKLKAKP